MRTPRLKVAIKAAPRPQDSWLNGLSPVDYADTYRAEWRSGRQFPAEEMLIAIFCRPPAWLMGLYKIRNWLVKLLRVEAETVGEGSGPPTEKLAGAIRAGASFRAFSVPFKSPAETVLLGKDRHLDFYLSIQTGQGGDGQQWTTAATLVRYHNAAGRRYFFFVRPVHRLIVPMMMKRAIRALEGAPPALPA
ncbi:MAG: DUF2867 domain-containing protein [Candidatus Adiutrix sp.]|jgi:hypothetical protein|nr:DUF2867 domain-containing protein [Candidatus Adiutrix sp.]